MNKTTQRDLMHELVLPTLPFSALGGMSWAVRGSRGFGGSAGCIFAGLLWGVAWRYIARDSSGRQSRPYASGWDVLALMLGIGLFGDRGWRQWSTILEGQIQLDFRHGKLAPVSPIYDFMWNCSVIAGLRR